MAWRRHEVEGTGLMTIATTPATGKASPFGRMTALSQEHVVGLITLLLLIVFAVALPGFATAQNLLGLVRGISILGILGLGMGLVVISRGIDLSEVALMACPWAIALIAIERGLPSFWAAMLALVIAASVGAVNGLMIAFVEAPALFVTLATTLAIYGAAYWVAPVYVVYANHVSPALLFFGQASLFGLPMPIVVFAAAALSLHWFLSGTALGRFMYAQGDNPEAAWLSGIALRPQIVLEYVLVAVFAWLAGLVWVGQTGSMQTNIVIVGTKIFDVILVVVLGGISLVGGRGGVLSVVVGCALIGTLLNALTIMDVNSEAQNIIRGAVLLVAIVVDNWLHPRDEETTRQGD
jgi:ribose transport system permease protein